VTTELDTELREYLKDGVKWRERIESELSSLRSAFTQSNLRLEKMTIQANHDREEFRRMCSEIEQRTSELEQSRQQAEVTGVHDLREQIKARDAEIAKRDAAEAARRKATFWAVLKAIGAVALLILGGVANWAIDKLKGH
jgi:predicted nuclease with TOPRIM domain